MWLDGESQEAVDQFWQRCGEIEPFPRNLEKSIPLSLPVRLIKLPCLRLHGVESWFERRGTSFSFNCRSRAVRGCLIAYGGKGLIFVDVSDPEDEQRFTVAHEAGHFIVDYLLVRRRAISKLGKKILEVFDGQRMPSLAERVHALLAGTPLGVYTDMMEREDVSALSTSEVWDIEDRADRVALALLAPPEDVLSQADMSAASFDGRREAMSKLLHERFGLPESVADAYALSLLEEADLGPSWAETFGSR